MRELNKKLKRVFIDYISIESPEVQVDKPALLKLARKIFGEG
jgi:hypothetical protein